MKKLNILLGVVLVIILISISGLIMFNKLIKSNDDISDVSVEPVQTFTQCEGNVDDFLKCEYFNSNSSTSCEDVIGKYAILNSSQSYLDKCSLNSLFIDAFSSNSSISCSNIIDSSNSNDSESIYSLAALCYFVTSNSSEECSSNSKLIEPNFEGFKDGCDTIFSGDLSVIDDQDWYHWITALRNKDSSKCEFIESISIKTKCFGFLGVESDCSVLVNNCQTKEIR